MNSKEITDYINKLMNYTYTQLEIEINKSIKSYKCFETFYYTPLEITMQEHKLLTELFTIWGGYNE